MRGWDGLGWHGALGDARSALWLTTHGVCAWCGLHSLALTLPAWPASLPRLRSNPHFHTCTTRSQTLPPTPQPLIPSREDEHQFGLPKPLGRWRDAEPLLEEDARCARMPPDFRWGAVGRAGGPHPGLLWCTASLRTCVQGGGMPERPPSASRVPRAHIMHLLRCPRRERVWRRYVDDELWNR